MNKKFTTFFTGYGLEVNGNFAYGNVNGYETNATVVMFDTVAPLRLHISFYATDDQKRNIEASIRNLALKFFSMQFSPYGLSLGFNDMTVKRLLKRLPEVLDKIYGVLAENGALTSEYCPVCGNKLEEETLKKCNVDGYTITLDNDCVNTINTVINEENQDFKNAPNNYLKGFLGAFIGGLAGVAVAVLLYVAGFVSSLSAVISIVLGAFLYEKFHGKPNKMMVVIVSLTTLVMLAATVPAVYIVAAGIAANEASVNISAIDAFNILMLDDEFSRMFYSDLALIILFSVLGTVFEIFVLAKRVKRKKSI